MSKKIILCHTLPEMKYKETRFGDNFNVYQNLDRELYVHFPDDIDFIRPVLWAGEPCKTKRGQTTWFRQDDFKHEAVSLGAKINQDDYEIVNMELSDYLKIEENPTVAIAQLILNIDTLTKKVANRLESADNKALQRIDAVSRDLAKTDKKLLILGHRVNKFWKRYLRTLSALQTVFNRKKWKKRFENACSVFFYTHDNTPLFKEEEENDNNLPF